jgi:aldose 1-epimerase
LVIDPERGGSLARFDWCGEPLFRPACGPTIFDSACFPLVPFSNRIARGRFGWEGRDVTLAPNFPGGDHPHPLHGMGWLSAWQVSEADEASAILSHDHAAGDWPWAYRAEQRMTLSARGFEHRLRVINLSQEPMPAGLGFHPYFPQTEATIYHGLHLGEWTNDEGGLPLKLRRRERACDWWQGQPVATRHVDTVYVGRQGPLLVTWPERRLKLSISPSAELADTVVYNPGYGDFFCVEPVSHATDALNQAGNPSIRRLATGEIFEVTVQYAAALDDANA